MTKKELDEISAKVNAIIHRLDGLLDESYAYEFFLGTTLELQECSSLGKEVKLIIDKELKPKAVVITGTG
jgi:hypothetical protein